MHFHYLKYILSSIVIVSAGAFAADSSSELMPIGEPACTAKTKAELHIKVTELAGHRDPQAAWQLIEVFLCGAREKALQVIEPAVSSAPLFKISSPTGVEITPLSDVRQALERELPAEKAWNPNVRIEETNLVVYYSVDQYCWNFFGLHFAENRWQVFLLGGGCD